jgi:RNA recognition motif-containing protein
VVIKEKHMSYKILVCNIPDSMSSIDLSALFSNCGKVLFATVVQNKSDSTPLGFGFVGMESEEGRVMAIHTFNGREVCGKILKALPIESSQGIPRAKILDKGTCVLCGKEDVLAGYTEGKGICAACARLMGTAHFQNGSVNTFA